MHKRNSRLEFAALAVFLAGTVLLLTNGFAGRINAADNRVDVYQQIEPIGSVIDTIMREYVGEVEVDKVVEGALSGMLQSLDRHSSFISVEDLQLMREDTRGEFEGIGVSIRLDDDDNVSVVTPIAGSPAAQAGLLPYDIIAAIDGISTFGMTTADAAEKIRGPKGTTVTLTILRKAVEPGGDDRELEITVKRDKVPLESIKEAGLIDGDIGYIRISDFKENTARDIRNRLREMLDDGMEAFILDLRWNPGGLLTSSKEVAQLFLPRNSLVTYTKGRTRADGSPSRDDMQLYTEGRPVLPPDFPVIVLVNENTASSAEIVTGALQYHQRALIVGEKTFGKGSVQTIIPLENPPRTALRLTTALYYTPADVTIDQQGILPDVEVPMSIEMERALGEQMFQSFTDDPMSPGIQNHGTVTGAEPSEDLVEDIQLQRAVEILREDRVWDRLLQKYHRDVGETQVAYQSDGTAKAAVAKQTAATAEATLEDHILPIDEVETVPQPATDEVPAGVE